MQPGIIPRAQENTDRSTSYTGATQSHPTYNQAANMGKEHVMQVNTSMDEQASSLREEYKDLQYLPVHGNFFMPPGTGLPYMDPYGIMNPAASPPLFYTPVPKKTMRKKRAGCC